MPQHPYAPSDSAVECPSTLDCACDAPCTVDSCCQRHPAQYIVGDCIPNDKGVCQRSTSDCCFDPTRGPCCRGDSDARELTCRDGCRTGCSLSCTLDSPSLECHREDDRDCCSGCTQKNLSGCGQACPVGTGAIDHNVVASTVEADCYSLSASAQACPVGTGRTADNGNDAASAMEDDCCSDCVPKNLSASGPNVDTPGTGREGATHFSNHPHLRSTLGHFFCCCLIDRRRKPPRQPHRNLDHPHSHLGHTRNKATARTPEKGHPRPRSTLGHFFEVACCCLIDRRKRPLRQPHCNDNHPHSHLDHPQHKATARPASDFGLVPEKGHQLLTTEDAAEQGGGAIQPLLLTVNGMDCPACARKVERALRRLPSVQDIKVNVFTSQASLTYTEGLIFPHDIAIRTAKLTGFRVAVDEARLEGKLRILRIKFPATPRDHPSLPPGVVILKASRTESSVIYDVQYDATAIPARSVLDIFVSVGGSFLPPSRSNASEQVASDIIPLFRRTFMSAILCTPVVVFSWAQLHPHPITYGGISLFLATCIQFYVGAPVYSAAFYSLFVHHVLDLDVLVALSSTIAYVFSLVAYVVQAAGHGFSAPFFETPALLLTLISFGTLISAYSRRRATSVLDALGTLQPDHVQRVLEDGATVTVTHVDLVQPHDVVRISSNIVIPTDGVVLRGSTQVDESALTGESLPVNKAPGSPLTAGTRNLTRSIDMEVLRAPAENTLAELAALVARLQETRLPIQDLADRVAALFAPIILALAVITFVVWTAIGWSIRGEVPARACSAALRYTIAVLVVCCPCAIVLCVPMVIVITGAVAIREGVVFKTVTAVQHAKNTTVAVFDKTGTLTLGQMGVVQAHILREDVVGTILALVSQDTHPVALAVARYLRSTYPDISAVPLSDQVQSLPGKGLEMTINDVRIRGGSPSWLGLEFEAESPYSPMARKALTMFAVTIHTEVVAFFGLTDKPRPSSAAAVEILQREGIQVHIVSGDARPVVHDLAKQLGIPHERAIGGCLPAEKVAYVRVLQAAGACVMFVGDGTNDTPALAAADIGVAMGSGTDVARSAADIVFLAPDLARALAVVLRLSRGAVRRVQLNFAWSFIYNLLAVLLAGGALVKVRIAPEYAALGEMVSVLPVMLIAWSMWFLRS
ncbi:E1-E2 ATPase-domain-containing protein [Russula dissimulans]|nr:E1-E2 ATPase-domain-containing protein [Russula dissimulans]